MFHKYPPPPMSGHPPPVGCLYATQMMQLSTTAECLPALPTCLPTTRHEEERRMRKMKKEGMKKRMGGEEENNDAERMIGGKQDA